MFRPRKGIEVLLEAVADLRARGVPVRLRAVGGFATDGYEREVTRFADRLGLGAAVEWTGFRRDVNAELAAMDIFVLPSLITEGMPMSILEAMAAGVPVIGTRVDGITDIVRDGVDGLLITPGDRQDLARAIERIVSGEVDWPAIRIAAHRRHAEEFSDLSMAAGVVAVYETCIRNDVILARAVSGSEVGPVETTAKPTSLNRSKKR
jgi:glycosyltransferase involved in cell wall biosynthesis